MKEAEPQVAPHFFNNSQFIWQIINTHTIILKTPWLERARVEMWMESMLLSPQAMLLSVLIEDCSRLLVLLNDGHYQTLRRGA